MAEVPEKKSEDDFDVPISPSVAHLPEALARNLSKGHNLDRNEVGRLMPRDSRRLQTVPQWVKDEGWGDLFLRMIRDARKDSKARREVAEARRLQKQIDLASGPGEAAKDPRYASMPAESAALAEVLDLDLGVIIYRGDRKLDLSEAETLIYESACLAAKDRLSKADRDRLALLLEAMKAATEAARSVMSNGNGTA